MFTWHRISNLNQQWNSITWLCSDSKISFVKDWNNADFFLFLFTRLPRIVARTKPNAICFSPVYVAEIIRTESGAVSLSQFLPFVRVRSSRFDAKNVWPTNQTNVNAAKENRGTYVNECVFLLRLVISMRRNILRSVLLFRIESSLSISCFSSIFTYCFWYASLHAKINWHENVKDLLHHRENQIITLWASDRDWTRFGFCSLLIIWLTNGLHQWLAIYFVSQIGYHCIAVCASISLVMLMLDNAEAMPTQTDKTSSGDDHETDYRLRNWGDSPMPFSISYSQFARDLLLPSSTASPHTLVRKIQMRRANRRRNRTRSSATTTTTTTERSFYMPLIFKSGGWGPSRW